MDDVLGRVRAVDKIRLGATCTALRDMVRVKGECCPVLRDNSLPEQYSMINAMDEMLVQNFAVMIRRLSRLERKLRKRRVTFGTYLKMLDQLMCLDSERLMLPLQGDVLVNCDPVMEHNTKVPLMEVPCVEAVEETRASIVLTLIMSNSRTLTIEWMMAWYGWTRCHLTLQHGLVPVGADASCASSVLATRRECTMAIGLRALTSGNNALNSPAKETIITVRETDEKDALVCAPMEVWTMQRVLGLLCKSPSAKYTVLPSLFVCWMGRPNAYLRHMMSMIPRVFFFESQGITQVG